MLCAVWLTALPAASAAEVFVTPRLDTAVGATSNRFLDPSESASGFGRLAPALELLWLAPRGLEISGQLHHERVAYLREGFSATRRSWAEVGFFSPMSAVTVGLSAAAGSFADGAIPQDDHIWYSAEPSVSAPLGAQLTGYLGAGITGRRYATRSTADGGTQRDWQWDLRSGLSWAAPAGATVWVEPGVQGLDSNQAADVYRGAGLAAGADALVGPLLRTGAWGSWHARTYPDGAPTGGRLRETLWAAGGWAALRLARWAEMTAAGSWLGLDSSAASGDYGAWTAEVGLRILYDWEL